MPLMYIEVFLLYKTEGVGFKRAFLEAKPLNKPIRYQSFVFSPSL